MPLPPPASPDLLDALTEINVDDLLDAAGLMRWRHTPLRRLFRAPARRFARLAHEFDQRVGAQGLAAGSAWLLQQVTAALHVSGDCHVPASGPLLIVANHPGMSDTIALLSALACRPDLRVIAGDRPFLRALPQVARSLILVPEGDGERLPVLRAGVAHLKQGGALLNFPAGRIEPDPATFGPHQALASLQDWSDSAALFVRRVPQTRWLAALVSDVVSAQVQRHPLTWLRRSAHDKEKLAAALQVALPRYHDMSARVAFGPLQTLGAEDAGSLHAAMVAQARQLIEALPCREAAATSRGPASRGGWQRHPAERAALRRLVDR
ncbi:1-acyl-sn-glycerol-3-phosphate acyltransferase [Aquabacterium sp.]|uniref:1-acyl-sn-glycerol-3-phosphate acyltransferase n=1 Tax=Aquabacterium sp. TaxID=1872578 RepID=UPI002B837007|nr:1-acyl-sn-glycerol-3-phosphate acyltransferase [Aquabacterium sp.]HSW06473.1 1-acyl-sn-glycerol-3-phosphate acyltransferase [Aquabacterium sp.]